MGGVESVDIIVAAILGIALLRGLFLGLVREAFSLAGLGAAYIAVTLFARPAAEWVERWGEIGPSAAPWVAAVVLAIGSIALVVAIGRLLRRGVRAAGLSWLDRLGGAALGFGEGALVVGILLSLASGTVGRDHPIIARTRSLAALQQFEQLVEDSAVRRMDVAAPPPHS